MARPGRKVADSWNIRMMLEDSDEEEADISGRASPAKAKRIKPFNRPAERDAETSYSRPRGR